VYLKIGSDDIEIYVLNINSSWKEFLEAEFNGYYYVEHTVSVDMARPFLLLNGRSIKEMQDMRCQLQKIRSDKTISNIFFDSLNPSSFVITQGLAARDPKVDVFFCTNNEAAKLMVLRLIRALLVMVYVAAGRCFIHASGISFGEKIIAFVGDKRAGKTTLLLSMLEYTSAKPVTNDKLMLNLLAGSVRAKGLPIKVGIREGSLHAVPGLLEKLNRVPRLPRGGDKTIRITIDGLAAIFRKTVISSGELAVIMLTEYCPDLDNYEFFQLSAEAAEQVWESCTLKLMKEIEPEQALMEEYFQDIWSPMFRRPDIPFIHCKSNERCLSNLSLHIENMIRGLN
jgi:hypothetical protein